MGFRVRTDQSSVSDRARSLAPEFGPTISINDFAADTFNCIHTSRSFNIVRNFFIFVALTELMN